MTPEQRERMTERMRQRGMNPAATGASPTAATPRTGRGGGPNTTATGANSGGATTIDALFGPLARPESSGRIWIHADNQ